MYLKALELAGFKSFPDKTRLEFRDGITGIVGPNGSGKSNISDALRWVMGETSYKALRGGKMEDVIFGGTQKRGPKGYCEVTLILDNADGAIREMGAEVEITRRYYRSGDSEYRVNRQNVRLRDINELLMDTGLGRDGYSIIGQGRIDEILSVKSTDRREIFEAAAGISRYRFRKEEAGRKLERATQDMVRAGDKIAELELQLEPLREQSKAAKEYLSLRDQLKDLEISLWTKDLEILDKRREELAEAMKDMTLQKAKAESELEKLYAGGEELSQRVAAADIESARIRDEISAEEAKSAENAAKMAEIRTSMEAARENRERLEKELSFQKDREGGVLRQIEQREAQMAANETAIEEKRGKILEIQRDLSGLDTEDARQAAQLAEAAAEESLNTEKLTSARDQLNTLSAMAQELEDRDTALLRQIHEAEERLQQEESSREACMEELEKAQAEEKKQENALRGYVMRLDSRRSRSQKAQEAERTLSMQLGALKNRIDLLKEMEKDYTGFSRAVKTVMQEKNAGRLRNVVGTVAENFKVPDAYTLAVETALGAAIGDIITETDEDAKAAVQLLKRRDGGRATFLPISTVRGSVLAERGLERERGYEGIASQLVSFEERLKGVYQQLLGRTVIASDMDSAIAIARKYSYRFRIVTLDGQVTNVGGSITGGSSSRSAGILSRANELERLSREETDLETRAREAAQALQNARREEALAENDVNAAQDAITRAHEAAMVLSTRSEQFGVLIDTLRQSMEASVSESRAIGDRIKDTTEKIADLRAEIEELENRGQEISRGLEEISRLRGELAEKVTGASGEITELRTGIAALEAENASSQAAVEELKQLMEAMGGDRDRQRLQIEEMTARTAVLEQDLKAVQTVEDALREKIAELRRRSGEASEKKLSLEAERARRDKRVQDANNRVLNLERDLSEQQRKLDAAESDVSHLTDRLWESYELSRSAAMEIRKELEGSREANQRQANSLKRQMSALGSPNLGAIEEYQRVSERYNFLTGQRDDIQTSIDELNQLIGEISGNMETIFSGEFENIRVSFRETFHDLFGGGTAELSLDDPEHILESGIEILVQPPGKKLRNLSLLSGGEKAYVAIALYFAILKVHAAPFVVMDEIEAALDEENVLRFAGYMRRMCDKTQFLVITHRRGTMEEADMLYGVTMEEQGVSKVLSMDLQEAEKTAGA